VIVGGGFAGVDGGARVDDVRAECGAGRGVIGWVARTYTADHDGHAMELGGTGGAPILQPNVVAEISRNGMEAETFPVLWGGRPHVRGRR
jgi:hypothetical protein